MAHLGVGRKHDHRHGGRRHGQTGTKWAIGARRWKTPTVAQWGLPPVTIEEEDRAVMTEVVADEAQPPVSRKIVKK